MPFLRLQLDSATGSRVQEAEIQFGKEVFLQHTYLRDFRSPRTPDSSQTCSDPSPVCCLLMQPLITLSMQFFFLFSVSIILGCGFASLLYTTLQLNQGPNKKGFINKREKRRLLISLNNVFSLFLKKRLCDPAIMPR